VRAAVCVLGAAAALAGCGGGTTDQTASPATPQPAPSAATETATATPTATASATPTATTQPLPSVSPEDQPGGAGDEEPIRVPAQFTVRPDAVDPPAVSVPAFLTIQLIVRNDRDAPIVVRLEGAEPLSVAAHASGRAVLEGRKKGRYPIDFGNGRSALLVSGAQPGP
jgi:hypothetical protein